MSATQAISSWLCHYSKLRQRAPISSSVRGGTRFENSSFRSDQSRVTAIPPTATVANPTLSKPMRLAALILPSNESQGEITVVVKTIWFIQVKGNRINLTNLHRAVPIEETLQRVYVLIHGNGIRRFAKTRVQGKIAPCEIPAIQMFIEPLDLLL